MNETQSEQIRRIFTQFSRSFAAIGKRKTPPLRAALLGRTAKVSGVLRATNRCYANRPRCSRARRLRHRRGTTVPKRARHHRRSSVHCSAARWVHCNAARCNAEHLVHCTEVNSARYSAARCSSVRVRNSGSGSTAVRSSGWRCAHSSERCSSADRCSGCCSSAWAALSSCATAAAPGRSAVARYVPAALSSSVPAGHTFRSDAHRYSSLPADAVRSGCCCLAAPVPESEDPWGRCAGRC